MPESSILWQNEAKTVVLLDLPRSIEEAQYLSDKQMLPGHEPPDTTAPFRRLICSPAPEQPFVTPEPKSSDYAQPAISPAAQIAELMTMASVKSALDEISTSYQGPWCLPRLTSKPPAPVESKQIATQPEETAAPPKSTSTPTEPNPPPKATEDHTVWVTNSPRFTTLLLNDIFPYNWGIELVAEWTWVKVTSRGEPIVSLGSQWRKPYERLLIARKKGACAGAGGVKNKVIVSVPDIHSRKPNLKRVFEEVLPRGYTALEMFARNLTAGWWGWMDEVMKFQGGEYWAQEEVVEGEEVVGHGG
ncbi:uncharacterized protein PODANS_6_3240 [Podospora anserina S mat+]|uniref:Podospora anserina S mat+ genomic DNA chromosome 6, supercontig 2 n=1 Tax=Podospora anserina (strain S / ATCC MYA-4624 / DSM 980 / FGSC 10383) TaxID=515849 RepID=B2B2G8_PODAN|nr:uncharacterized protein PODANS_6_3240 [Podospora anserina S mat+]CAP71303.1 unnamed protein product [Podospora anserina S mat+]